MWRLMNGFSMSGESFLYGPCHITLHLTPTRVLSVYSVAGGCTTASLFSSITPQSNSLAGRLSSKTLSRPINHSSLSPVQSPLQPRGFGIHPYPAFSPSTSVGETLNVTV